MRTLGQYAKDKGIECSFILLKASQFASSFGKPDFSKTQIVFSSADREIPARVDVFSSLSARDKNRERFYYLFYKRPEKSVELDKEELCKRLMGEFV